VMRLVADGFQNEISVESDTAAAALRVDAAAVARVANDVITDISERNKLAAVTSKLLLLLLLLPLRR
jgi:hypothetical protein